jgi:hypothetical protein
VNVAPSNYMYGPPPPQYGAAPYVPGQPTYGAPGAGYGADVYRPTGPHQTGYVQGSMAAAGASSSIASAATGIGSIFTSLTSIIAKLLNSLVSIVVNIFKAIGKLFGFGKDKAQQQAQQQAMGPQQMMPQQQGAQMGGMPAPPPGTNVDQARAVVQGDLQSVQDPGTAFRHIDLHAKKATDNRRQAESEARNAEILAQEASALAQKIAQSQGRMHPQELNQTLSQLETKKSQAMESLKRAEEYTKATYDEALYAHLAMETLVPRFPQTPQMAQDAHASVQEAWKNWTTGAEETQYLFFKKQLPAAPELFTRAVGSVNAHLNQVDQILSRISIQR